MAFSPYRGGISLRSVSPDLTPTQIAAREAALAAQAAAETAQGLAETAKTDAETAETGAQAAETAAVVAQGLAEDAQAAAEAVGATHDAQTAANITSGAATQAAGDGRWAPVAHLRLNVKTYGATGDGVTDDTAAIQAAYNALAAQYGGDVSQAAGYTGWFRGELVFPPGTYICGPLTASATGRRISFVAESRATIKALGGSSTTKVGTFFDGVVNDLYVEGLTFLYFATVWRVPTNNIDFSFITFNRCGAAYVGEFVDTVGYNESRSTTFLMERCVMSYGVDTCAKVYTDKATFKHNWWVHSSLTSTFFYISAFAHFEDNVWVPTGGSNSRPNKAWIYFTTTDATRSLLFTNERLGTEPGGCPLVVVGPVNTLNANNAYRSQGIRFENCYLGAATSYDPDATGTLSKAIVILRDPGSAQNAIQYVTFEDCAFLPDLSGGVVQTYGAFDPVAQYGADEFVIRFDHSSILSATRGVNVPVSANLREFLSVPPVARRTSAAGKVVVSDTVTTGSKKATFQIDRGWPAVQHTPLTFMVTVIGQGDTSYPNLAYAYQSVYILTISGENSGTTRSKIAYTKLHGVAGGTSLGANADITSAHFGTADTGSNLLVLDAPNNGRVKDVTIVFGTRVSVGAAYVTPLHDPSLTI